jgi:hypothetical protein
MTWTGDVYIMVKKETCMGAEKELEDKILKDKTFVLKIKYNQNHSMQGSIQWVEKKKTVNFRSMMELILLLSESMESKDIRSWDGSDGMLEMIKSIGI